MDDKKGGKPYDGVKAVAEMMQHLGPADRERLMKDVAARDPGLAERIRKKVFTFDDLQKVDVQGVQILLQEVPRPQWLLALRQLSEGLKTHLASAMSDRAWLALEEDMTDQGPQRLSDVQASQEFIASRALELLASGKIRTK
ncbi:MAG: hypothetical protein IT285_01285 [Bdellovibrionales bacterium]|nr:hypothetical protein [Bdellovibrionales bacterium]